MKKEESTMIKRFLEYRRRKALVARLHAVVAPIRQRPAKPVARYSFDNQPAPFSR